MRMVNNANRNIAGIFQRDMGERWEKDKSRFSARHEKSVKDGVCKEFCATRRREGKKGCVQGWN
jgi:hypothetical protein